MCEVVSKHIAFLKKKHFPEKPIVFPKVPLFSNMCTFWLAVQASIVLEWYFRFEVSLLSFYACERDGPIWASGGSDIIT